MGMVTDERGNRHAARRRYRRRRHHRLPRRSHRAAEIWIVAAVSLVVLGTGISWIMSEAYPGSQQAVRAILSGGPPSTDGASSQIQTPAPVIILEDKSDKPDNTQAPSP